LYLKKDKKELLNLDNKYNKEMTTFIKKKYNIWAIY